MSVTSMFAGDNKNQWLDQVEDEFGSNLFNHGEDNINSTSTTIELGKDANASLAKEMKGKDYDLEDIKSCSSKQTHCTNMMGKTGMSSTQSVTTKKFATDFSQQKRDLNAEQKKSAALEQCLKEMESALTAGYNPHTTHRIPNILPSHKIKLSAFLFPPQQATPLLHRNLIPSWTNPPPMKTLLLKWAAVPWLMWVGGIKSTLVSPLLQVDIGGVGRTPLGRNLYHQPTSLKTGTHHALLIATLTGPHVWLPI